MKKAFAVLLLLLLSVCTAAYAIDGIDAEDFTPLWYDFEEYTGGLPEGWAKAGNNAALEAVESGEDYGTSMLVNTGAAMYYKLPTSVVSGRWTISFDVKPMDYGQQFRIHTRSDADDYDSHSIFSMDTEGNICSADTGHAWTFRAFASYQAENWYRIDLLFDMDNASVSYYLNNAFMASEQIKFEDIAGVYFRTESGTEGSKMLLDNIRMGGLTDAGIFTEYGDSQVPPDAQSVALQFEMGVDTSTLTNLAVYNMGDNPIEPIPQEQNFTMAETGYASCILAFPEGLAPGVIYKVDTSGVLTLFGDLYATKEVYFMAGGITETRNVVEADFSAIEFDSVLAPVDPPGDIEWTKGGTTRVFPVYSTDIIEGEETPVVRFQAYRGNQSYPSAYCTLSRPLNEPLSDQAVITYKTKVVHGNQTLSVYDMEEHGYPIVSVHDGFLYLYEEQEETEIAPLPEGWFVLSLQLDLNAGTANVLLDGAPVLSKAPCDLPTNIARLEFAQENAGDSYNDDTFPQEQYADSFLAYCCIGQDRDVAAVSSVRFLDANGTAHTTETAVPAASVQVKITFSDEVLPQTIEGAVTMENTENGETFVLDGTYDEETHTYLAELPNYLEGGTSYLMTIADSICDRNGIAIKGAAGEFAVGLGQLKVLSLEAARDGNDVAVYAEIEHTDGADAVMYLVLAGYRDEEMVHFQFIPCTLDRMERKMVLDERFADAGTEGCDRVSCFIWDSFSHQKPMIHYIDVSGF